jgi:hypothetical protein
MTTRSGPTDRVFTVVFTVQYPIYGGQTTSLVKERSYYVQSVSCLGCVLTRSADDRLSTRLRGALT